MATPRTLVVIALLLLAPACGYAHELWAEVEAGELVLHRGHLQGGHEGAPTLPLDAARVTATVVGPEGLRHSDRRLVLDLPLDLALFDLDGGFFTKTLQGTRPVHPREVDRALDSWSSRASMKWIGASTPSALVPIGVGGLEITPLELPSALDRGDKLTVLVTLDGQPCEGAIVTYSGRPRGVTDSGGHINVRLRDEGTQHVGASLQRRALSGEVAREVFEAFLQFDLEAR